jgi:hypothetical protein
VSPDEEDGQGELAGLQDLALVVEDPRMAEQMMLVLGVVTAIWGLHQVDAKRRCLLCRPSGCRLLWRQHQPCTVHAVFKEYRLELPPQREAEQ